MPYDAEQQADGTVLIRDVRVMGRATRKQRPDWGRDIDADWMLEALANFRTLAEATDTTPVLPPIYDGHTAERVAGSNKMRRVNAPVIGRIASLRFDETDQTLRANLWLTDAQAIATWKQGGFPGLSPEFFPDLKMLKGVAFLRGETPHFESFPDLAPKEFFDRVPKALAVANAETETTLAAGSRVDMEAPAMELNKEQMGELADMVADRLKPLVEAHAGKKAEDLDVLAEIEAGVNKRMETIEQERAVEKRQNLIEAHASALASQGHYLSQSTIKKILAKCETEEGVVLKAQNLALASQNELKREREVVTGPETVEAALARQWDEEKLGEQYPETTKEDWIAQNKHLFTIDDFKAAR